MATQPTYDDVNLILRLYELRREDRMRKARDWLGTLGVDSSFQEFGSKYPPGSEGNAHFRMVFGYWEMAASFVTSGVLNEELFFQNCGECFVLWEKVKQLVPEMRKAFNMPNMAKNIETVANRYAEWANKQAPGSYEGFQNLIRQMSPGAARSTGSA